MGSLEKLADQRKLLASPSTFLKLSNSNFFFSQKPPRILVESARSSKKPWVPFRSPGIFSKALRPKEASHKSFNFSKAFEFQNLFHRKPKEFLVESICMFLKEALGSLRKLWISSKVLRLKKTSNCLNPSNSTFCFVKTSKNSGCIRLILKKALRFL